MAGVGFLVGLGVRTVGSRTGDLVGGFAVGREMGFSVSGVSVGKGVAGLAGQRSGRGGIRSDYVRNKGGWRSGW